MAADNPYNSPSSADRSLQDLPSGKRVLRSILVLNGAFWPFGLIGYLTALHHSALGWLIWVASLLIGLIGIPTTIVSAYHARQYIPLAWLLAVPMGIMLWVVILNSFIL